MEILRYNRGNFYEEWICDILKTVNARHIFTHFIVYGNYPTVTNHLMCIYEIQMCTITASQWAEWSETQMCNILNHWIVKSDQCHGIHTTSCLPSWPADCCLRIHHAKHSTAFFGCRWSGMLTARDPYGSLPLEESSPCSSIMPILYALPPHVSTHIT